MNLIGILNGNPEPGLVQEILRDVFREVEVESVGDGSIKLHCFDEERCRMIVRYFWTEAMGWIYSILPQRNHPRRPYQRGAVQYRPDGSFYFNP